MPVFPIFPEQAGPFSPPNIPHSTPTKNSNFFQNPIDKSENMLYNTQAVTETGKANESAAIAQPVERILGKDEVASSNLASSSKPSEVDRFQRVLFWNTVNGTALADSAWNSLCAVPCDTDELHIIQKKGAAGMAAPFPITAPASDHFPRSSRFCANPRRIPGSAPPAGRSRSAPGRSNPWQ